MNMPEMSFEIIMTGKLSLFHQRFTDMNESKITHSGQTTIPSEVRQYLGIQSGDTIKYIFDEGKVVIIPAARSIREIKGRLPKPQNNISVDEMDQGIAKAASSNTIYYHF